MYVYRSVKLVCLIVYHLWPRYALDMLYFRHFLRFYKITRMFRKEAIILTVTRNTLIGNLSSMN